MLLNTEDARRYSLQLLGRLGWVLREPGQPPPAKVAETLYREQQLGANEIARRETSEHEATLNHPNFSFKNGFSG